MSFLTGQRFDGLIDTTNGGTEEDSGNMHVDREFAVISGGIGEFPVNHTNSQMVEDTKQANDSFGPREIEIYTVSAMQTPCRCKNQYAFYL